MKMEAFYQNECRMCMSYRHLKPLDTEMVRKIGTCFGILINLEDKTLPLGICRKCTKKVTEVKKYRDFYLSVQTKLFVKRSNYFLRIDRQPLIEVILRRNESPRYIYPSRRRDAHEKKRLESKKTSRPSSKGSPDPTKSDKFQASGKGLKSAGSSSAIATSCCRTDVATSGVPLTLPNQRASPTPLTFDCPSPNTATPATVTSHVTLPDDINTACPEEILDKADLEAIERENISEKGSFAIVKMQMEVLESDMQSQEETETVDDFAPDFHEEKIDCTEDLEEDLQFQNMIDEADEAEYLDPKELNAGDSLDMKIQLKQAHFDPNEVEMLETTECNDIPVNENNTRDVQDTRRRRRSKISGRELYKSLLTECNICGKMIERNRLEGHINRHSGSRPYECPIEGCTSRFHCRHACRLHVRCRHGSESFTCAECGKIYKARRDLLGHIRETHVEPRFICDVCGKKFTTRSRLKQHRFYHTGERNYPCRVCEMRFFSNFQLKVHMRTHTKSFPYKCSVCNKRFRYRHMAKEHIVKDHGIDISLQKDWVIQYPEPDPEEVEVINEEKNIIQYSIQRLEETEEDENAIREDEDEDAAAVSLNIEKAIQGPSPTRMADTRNELYE